MSKFCSNKHRILGYITFIFFDTPQIWPLKYFPYNFFSSRVVHIHIFTSSPLLTKQTLTSLTAQPNTNTNQNNHHLNHEDDDANDDVTMLIIHYQWSYIDHSLDHTTAMIVCVLSTFVALCVVIMSIVFDAVLVHEDGRWPWDVDLGVVVSVEGSECLFG